MKNRSRIILVCVFAVFLFVLAMYAVRQDVDQDAARFGLMARHILAGKHFPVFYYGRSYTGSPKAYFMAAIFALFGPTNFAVILSTAILSAGFVILTFKFAEEAYGGRVALLTLAYLALPPPVLGCWYTKGVSPYVDLLVTGAGMMLLGYRLIFAELRGRRRCLDNLLFGLLAGIGWWLSPMILYYAVPLIVFWFIAPRFDREPIPPYKWQASSNCNQTEVTNAFDGDIDTRWSTGKPQREGMCYELDLGGVYEINGICLLFP